MHHCTAAPNDWGTWDLLVSSFPEPGLDPPIDEPEVIPNPIQEPDFPDDPGPSEDPERQPVVN
jgi:hypothetical protein